MELRAPDRRFGLVLSAEDERLLHTRSSASWPHETGGILIGRYNEQHDIAIVTQIPPVPVDSVSTRSRFIRGFRELPELLSRLWNRTPVAREYYLGEWHCHPGQAPVPSLQDEKQMKAIARDPKYRCPEPVLVIVGGTPVEWSIAAYVYPQGTLAVPLVPELIPR